MTSFQCYPLSLQADPKTNANFLPLVSYPNQFAQFLFTKNQQKTVFIYFFGVIKNKWLNFFVSNKTK